MEYQKAHQQCCKMGLVENQEYPKITLQRRLSQLKRYFGAVRISGQTHIIWWHS
jgi:hypothetical protein